MVIDKLFIHSFVVFLLPDIHVKRLKLNVPVTVLPLAGNLFPLPVYLVKSSTWSTRPRQYFLKPLLEIHRDRTEPPLKRRTYPGLEVGFISKHEPCLNASASETVYDLSTISTSISGAAFLPNRPDSGVG